MLNSASRSCWEKTSNATIVCVRLMPSMLREAVRDDLRDLLRVAHPQDRHEVPLAGDGVGLGDALDVGELAAERRRSPRARPRSGRRRGSFAAVCVSPGLSTSTSEKPAFWTSCLNACGVGLDGRERAVVDRDHLRRVDELDRGDGVVAVHRVVAADRHEREVDLVAAPARSAACR